MSMTDIFGNAVSSRYAKSSSVTTLSCEGDYEMVMYKMKTIGFRG